MQNKLKIFIAVAVVVAGMVLYKNRFEKNNNSSKKKTVRGTCIGDCG